MYIDLPERSLAGVEEPMRRVGRNDDDLAGVHLALVVGGGKRLFPAGIAATIPLKLVDTKTTSTGVLLLTYQPAS